MGNRNAILLFALTVGAGCSDGGGDGGGAPAPPPAEYAALYDELSRTLAEFESRLDAAWDGTIAPVAFAGALSRANGNSTIGLLTGTAWDTIQTQLNAFEAMGVRTVKVEVQYPTLTQAFHDYLAANPPAGMGSYAFRADHFIGTPSSFYNRLAQEIRGRGMDLWVEHATIFAAYSPTPPTGYFAEMRSAGLRACRVRYLDERSAEVVAIVANMSPRYLTLVPEPNTQNMNFGYFPGGIPLYTPDLWRDYVQYAAQRINAQVVGHGTLLGAGCGTWESRGYVELFAAIPELHYVDLHLYPLRTSTRNFLQDALDWADYVRGAAPGKGIMVGEAWLYKASMEELEAGADATVTYGRDVWSFWQPLDVRFLEILYKMANLKSFWGVMPFWSTYYFAYLTYGDPALAGLGPQELMRRAAEDALPRMESVTLTDTGRKFQEIVARFR